MKKNKKIVFLSNMAAPYQIENCKYLNETTNNDYTFIFCLTREDNRPKYWENIPFKIKNTITLKKPLFLTKSFYINKDIWSKLKEKNPDIIIVGGYNLLSGIYALIWAKLNKKHTILYLERFLPAGFIKGIIRYSLFRIIASMYDKFILVGNDAYKEYNYLKHKQNIPYLINLDRYNDSDKEYFYNNKVNFLYSGRFSKNQNVHAILDSFLELCKIYQDIRLILSGNGEELESLKQKIFESKYSNQIEIDNSYESWFELPDLYKKADILIAPLSHSGWGFVVEEAMSSSLGIISSYETSSAAEYIIDNYNGYMVNPIKSDIKKAMEQYINNRDLVKQHGKRNYLIKQNISYKYMIEKFDNFVIDDIKEN